MYSIFVNHSRLNNQYDGGDLCDLLIDRCQ